ncbi:MAG: hypothetical protein NTY10_03440 [Candidatus Omnitrophica bacterium]|nr:hypothetical protein [Candidatus Omnitrophota bacterium]
MSVSKVFDQKKMAFCPIKPSNAEAAFGRDSDIARAISRKLSRGPRPTVAIAINEKISGAPSRQLFAETTLHYYLDYCNFPVKNGENALLREYAGFYFANKPRTFPLTLTSKYYIIGVASAEPGENQSGLIGAKSELEIVVLDRAGKLFYEKKVKIEALSLSLEAAEAKALKVAASEIAVQVLPLLK